MADDVKVKITERNGAELEFDEELALEAKNVVYDPTDSGLLATDVKEGIDELATNVATSASPGFSWGRSGNVSTNTWLQNEGVSSNKAGRAVTFNDAEIVRIYSASEDLNTYTLSIYEHEGDSINLTLLTTLSVTSSRTGDSGVISIAVSTGRQVAIRLTSGSAKNILVGMNLSGSNT
jgi:hypothetical protein